MKTSSMLAVCGALSLALQMAPAAADPAPWYVGAGAGSATYGFPSTATPGITNDNSATAYRIDGGYGFGQYFAAEGLYADFGSANSTFAIPLGASASGGTRVKAWGLEAVGRLPLEDGFGLFARGGFVHYQARYPTFQIDPVTITVTTSSISFSGTTGVVGAGVYYGFNANWSLRAGWDYFQRKDGSPITHMPGVHLLSVEAVFQFN